MDVYLSISADLPATVCGTAMMERRVLLALFFLDSDAVNLSETTGTTHTTN